MHLPELNHPTYEVQIFSSKKPLRVRPFLVKEQKLLLMAKESSDIDTIVKTLKQIIQNCIVDKIDVDHLPMIDLEMIFLGLRAKSMGEKVSVTYQCKNEFNGANCDMILDTEIDISPANLEIQKGDTWKLDNKIYLDDEKKVGLVMKLPTFEITQQVATIKNEEEQSYALAALCIDYVFDENGIYHSKDATYEEMMNFVEQLTENKYELIEKYFMDSPIIRKTIEKKCGKCGFDHKYTLEGLEDFFL